MEASRHIGFSAAPPPSSFNFKQPGVGVGAGHARPRPRPNKVGASGPRDSSAVRASVFEVAMDLGITSNNLVAEWMFSNTLQEEDEEAAQTPELTHRTSVIASDDLNSSTSTFSSPRIPLTPPITTTSPPNAYGVLPTNGNAIPPWNASKPGDIDIKYIPHDSKAVAFPGFGGMPMPSRPTTPGGSSKKLMKMKRFGGADGDDSDGGGYLSDGNAVKTRKQSTKEKKEEKARLKEEKREAKEAAKEEKKRIKGLAAEEAKEEKEDRKRKKSFGPLSGKNKKSVADDTGYETDSLAGSTSRSPFKSKKKSKSKSTSPSRDPHDYDTDAGYASASSKKSKSRFFGLGSKSSKGDMRDPHGKEIVPPMPDPPMLPMLPPIASKFATSLGMLSPTDDEASHDDGIGGVDGNQALAASTSANFKPPVPIPPLTYPTSDGGSQAPMLASPPKHEPLSFDLSSTSATSSSSSYTPATTASSSTPTATTAPLSATALQDRSSLSSAETHTTTSSMSSNSRRRGYQFSPPPSSRGESMVSHTTAPSVSTINSTTASSMAPSLGHKASITTLNSTHALMPPSISLPLSRSASPSFGPASPVSPQPGPTAPLQISKHPKLPSLETGNVSVSRGPSPMPHSPPAPGSPYVTVTPSESDAARATGMSPLPMGAEHRLRPPRSPMPPSPVTPSAPPTPTVRVMSPPLTPHPHDPMSLNGRSTSPMPRPISGRISPNPLSRRRVSPLNLEQDVGRDSAMLPGPNVLAYYDIPPPSPPPVGPLPSVPPPPSISMGAASQLRNKVMERQRQVPDLNSLGAGVQRGKQSPFPTRPVVSPPPKQMFAGMYGSKKSGGGQEKRVRIISKPLDAFSSAGWEDDEEYTQQEYEYRGSQGYGEEAYYGADQRHSGLAYDDAPRQSSGYANDQHRGGYPADVGEEEMQEVLDRFADASVYGSSEGHGRSGSSAGHGEDRGAVARGGSFEALRSQAGPSTKQYNPTHSHSDSHVLPSSFSQLSSHNQPSTTRANRDSFAPSEYYSRDTVYRDSEYLDDRSIYSRVSILDPDQSEEARDRFVKRVEAMMKARGEEPEVVPPVPKLPEGLDNDSSTWNRF
ncbi:hypothetical protein FA13DRAFT_1713065 [Coprinellus micaceus]|uniref:Uncharacterized protein n=1 Tax=Coprinellus micaceus TaxID=71717 RepID=A0A4Y7SXY5_COPMI|nr:hypothetical protein FA13DRAFT_1713065 [Coprinellus micaceus]